MSHNEIQNRLNDFADGSLLPEEHEAVERHLARCKACRQEADAVGGLLHQARALPREIAPPRDLWPEIAARLRRSGAQPDGDPASAKVIEVDFRRAAHRSPWVARGWLAAAAVLLVAVSSAITAALVRRSPTGPLASAPTEQSAAPAPLGAALAAFRPAEVEYVRTADELAVILEQHRGTLAPETVAAIEENLRIVDRAIAESRAALEADPNNPALVHLLSGVYRKKVELLQRAVLLQRQS